MDGSGLCARHAAVPLAGGVVAPPGQAAHELLVDRVPCAVRCFAGGGVRDARVEVAAAAVRGVCEAVKVVSRCRDAAHAEIAAQLAVRAVVGARVP